MKELRELHEGKHSRRANHIRAAVTSTASPATVCSRSGAASSLQLSRGKTGLLCTAFSPTPLDAPPGFGLYSTIKGDLAKGEKLGSSLTAHG